MEGDIHKVQPLPHGRYFNPLPPHGGRLSLTRLFPRRSNFNPLPPHGGRPGDKHLLKALEMHFNPLPPHGGRPLYKGGDTVSINKFQSTPSAWRETSDLAINDSVQLFQSTPSAWRETAKLHRKAFFISPILVQSCKKGCKRLHSAPEKMVFFEKREKNLVRNLQHLSVRL